MILELKKCLLLIIVIVGFLANCSSTKYNYINKPPQAGKHFPGETWDVISDPIIMGWSSEKLNIAKKKFSKIGATAIMIVDDGVVVAEWGNTNWRVNSYSVRKSYLSALFGIFVSNNAINLQKTLQDLGIDDVDNLSDEEKHAKVIDLLKSRSGVYHTAAYETDTMKKKRPKRRGFPPGSFWYYNNWDFNTLGTIYEQESSTKIFEAFNKYIAIPIGMEDFRVSDGKYITERASIHPAYLFWMSARDMARFGLLFLRHGQWKEKQIIPEKWIEESTMPYSNVSPGIGYGYMWWVSNGNRCLGNKINGKAYFARGHWGQYIFILQEVNLVVVQVSDKNRGGRNASGKKFNELLSLILSAREK